MSPRFVLSFFNPWSVTSRALNVLATSQPSDLNSPAFRAVEIPSANGIETARSMARLYGDLATGGEALGLDEAVFTELIAPLVPPSDDRRDVVIGIETVGQALRTGDLKASFPGPDDLADLAAFNTPTLVILSERDPFFPASRIRPRVEQTLPALVECLTLAGERHFLSPTGQERVTDHIRVFLDELFGPDEE